MREDIVIVERYLIALSPLVLALIALFVIGPIGFHYARLEREERARRESLGSKPSVPTA
jgi:hypothetical protein